MTAEAVKSIILEEIAGDWDRPNPHGVDLRQCVLPTPQRCLYQDSFHDNKEIELWLVLEEDPTDQAGYEIIFDEHRNMFGLALGPKGGRVFIGYHGTFLNTLAGM